jgi:hypothetical protein
MYENGDIFALSTVHKPEDALENVSTLRKNCNRKDYWKEHR